ncbi:unnamed protein product [Umbelopsis ramanniana]
MSAVLLQGDLTIQTNDQQHNSCHGLTLHKEGKETATDVEQPRLGRFLVQYELLRVLPLASVKKYLLVNSRWRVYADPSSKELSSLFRKIFQCHPLLPSGDTRYSMLLKVRELSSIFLSTGKLDNPFIVGKDADDLLFPLPSTSYFLIYGEKLPDSSSLCIYASLLHEPNELVNIFELTMSNSCVKPGRREEAMQTLDKSTEIICQRSGLKRFSGAEHENTKKAKGEKELDYISALDRIREQNSKTVIERQIFKSKSTKQKKVTMIAVPTAVIGDKSAPSSPSTSKEQLDSSIDNINPTRAAERHERGVSMPSGSPMTATIPEMKDASSRPILTESTTARRKDEPTEAENKKVLKKMVWDKLLQRGYVKRDENTKAYYHQVYQSAQFILRNAIKKRILPVDMLDSVIEKHFEFYMSMEGFANLPNPDQ